MKRLLFLLLLLSLTSCGAYLQIATFHSNEMTKTDNGYEYSDDAVTVSYKINKEGPIFDFTITNNSEQDIYIVTDKSCFVYNGNVYDYAGWSTTSTLHSYNVSDVSHIVTNTSYNHANISGTSISNTHKVGNELVIPPGCHRVFKSFNINRDLYYNIQIINGLMEGRTVSIICYEEDSPVKLINTITYLQGDTERKVTNKLYLRNIETGYFSQEELNILDYSILDDNQTYKKILIIDPSEIPRSDGWVELKG